jgi:hypothetical protein
MTKLLAVCLAVTLSPTAPEAFSLANRVGQPHERSFFMFATSAGKYTIRHDGMGELNVNHRRRVLYLKVGAKSRIDQMYFFEHEGDLLLLYEIRGQGFMLVRMDQKKRKARWYTPLTGVAELDRAPVIDGNLVSIGETVVNTADGGVVNQD